MGDKIEGGWLVIQYSVEVNILSAGVRFVPCDH